MLRRVNDNVKKRREPSSGEMNGVTPTSSGALSFSPNECAVKKPHVEIEETDRAQSGYPGSFANTAHPDKQIKLRSESFRSHATRHEGELASDDSDEEKKPFTSAGSNAASPSRYGNYGGATPSPRTRNHLCLRTACQKQVKKLVLKSPLTPPNIPSDFQAQIWARLRAAIQAIHECRKVDYSLEGLYAGVEDICSQNLSKELYDRLVEEMDAHLRRVQDRLISETPGVDVVQFLHVINKTWQDHCEQTILIRSVFLTLDRRYAFASTTIRPIWDVGLELFRRHIATLPNVKTHTQQGVLDMIRRERNAELVDRSLLKNVVRMYVSLGLYADFERAFIEATEIYYKAESQRCLQELDVGDYLRRVESRLAEEVERIGMYLDSSTSSALIALVERAMITEKLEHILDDGFVKLFNDVRTDDITRMYALLARVNAHKEMRTAWNKCIKKYGSELVQDTGKDESMIEQLLAFKAKLEDILSNCFDKNSEFAYSLKEAFEFTINSRQNVPAELLANFLDRNLQVNMNTAASNFELEGLLDDVIHLFRYLNSKDVFEAFARRDLAKRLLLQKNPRIDAEKSLIMLLKSECGAQFISKMEGMSKDIDLSKDLAREFSQYLLDQNNASSPLGKIDTSVNVLTTGHWPPYNPVSVKLPLEFSFLEQTFTNFYKKRFSGRHLIWLNTHCHTTLKAKFPRGRRELFVSLFQTIICLLFNDADQLSYDNIKTGVGLADEDELKRTLLSLCSGKHKILIHHAPTNQPPLSRELGPGDSFSFNDDFTSKMVRIKINQIQLRETKVEQAKTQEGVIQDRLYQADAAIVRIMKARKTQNHNDLISELIRALRFPVQAADLKKRIEGLIEREYLSRDAKDPTIYNYVS